MGADEIDDPWSVTEKQLLDHLRSLRQSEREAAVVTVADVDGSAYRRPGAKMVVPADGVAAGAVTAGCLEEPVVDLANDVIDGGSPRVEVFDLVDDDEDTWGLGLGCNGIIDLFVEPLDASWDRALGLLADGAPVTAVTVVGSDGDPPPGSRVLVADEGSVHEVADRPRVPAEVIDGVEDATGSLADATGTRTVTVDGVTLLVDRLEPVPELLVFGSQNDVPPVVRLGATAGFAVTVYAGRGAVDEATFPAADTVTTGHPTAISDRVESDEHTYAVVMSHNLLDDRLAVEALLRETAVPYVGLMGPRERFEELRDALADDDVALSASDLDRVSTPVGLDLGGGEPVQIALSIVAEALAVSNQRNGGRLRERAAPIHPRSTVE